MSGPRGHHHHQAPGSSRGNGIGGYRGRGNWNRGRGRGQEGPRYRNSNDAELDHEVQALVQSLNLGGSGGRARGANRARGRGRGQPSFDQFAYTYHPAPKFRGRGIGFAFPAYDRGYTPTSGARTPNLDLRNRPFLKPIMFVKSKVLFQDENEIFEATAPEHEDNDAPTAARLENIFAHALDASPNQTPANQSDAEPRSIFVDSTATFEPLSDNDSDEIPVLDFGFTEAELISSTSKVSSKIHTHVVTAATTIMSLSVPVTPAPVEITATLHMDQGVVSSAPPPEAPANPQIDINQLFRLAAEEAHISTVPSLSPQLPAKPKNPSLSDTLSHSALGFFIDTEGDLHSRTPPVPQVITALGSVSFVIDTEGEPPKYPQNHSIPAPLADRKKKSRAKSKSKATSEPVQPSPLKKELLPDYAGFVLDVEGDLGKAQDKAPAKLKIKYNVRNHHDDERVLGDSSSESEESAEEDKVEDDDDIVVFVPPRPASTPPQAGPSIRFADLGIGNERIGGMPKASALISRQIHTGMSKKLKKMAKRQRRKGREREEKANKPKGLKGDGPSPDAGAADGVARVGDSDIEWGSDGPPGLATMLDAVMDVQTSITSTSKVTRRGKKKSKQKSVNPWAQGTAHLEDHGMDIDPDLDEDDAEYEKMLNRILQDQQHVTLDDVADIERMRQEDAEQGIERGSSASDDGDVGASTADEAISAAEVTFEIDNLQLEDINDSSSSSHEGEDDEDESSDEDMSFRTKLAKIREQSVEPSTSVLGSKHSPDPDNSDTSEDDEHDDYDALFGGHSSWADKDEKAIEHIQNVIDGSMKTMTRQERKKLFRSVENGDFENDPISQRNADIVNGVGKKNKKSGAYLPDALRDIWAKDKAKKADYKKARAEKRRLAEMDPFPKPKSRRDKGKGKEKALATTGTLFVEDSSEDDEDDEDDNNSAESSTSAARPTTHAVDLITLESQIRYFLSDLGRQTMVLPPMEKESRRRVHLLAEAFNLKSKSIGKGGARHTTLVRTTRSGIGIREHKIRSILRGGYGSAAFAEPHDRRAGSGSKTPFVRTKEGDVVGHKAAKIDAENVGFRLLERMGWKDGDKIGVTGGLSVPLTAVIKNTKRGLGA